MSAVVPIGIHDERSPLMPLVAGLSVAATLADYGLTDVHLRWPNDVMVHGRKCAGILVERFLPDRCVVGIGVNVLNDPTVEAPELIGSTTRLHDWLEECPDPYMVSVAILSTLRTTLRKMEQEGTAFLLDQLMPYWKVGHRVVVQINGQQESYVFWGVDGAGRVLLSGARGEIRAVAAENINLLRELTT
jgi:BirA family biotin operon repressor/biotin-[acetyl-CoA-carboxylase] ligase